MLINLVDYKVGEAMLNGALDDDVILAEIFLDAGFCLAELAGGLLLLGF